jgi:hypothetical protein
VKKLKSKFLAVALQPVRHFLDVFAKHVFDNLALKKHNILIKMFPIYALDQ